MTTQEILALKLKDNDAGAADIGEYLSALLETLWTEKEGFSGKRPFGNSGWEWPIYEALVKANLVEGNFDTDGYLEHVNPKVADDLILDCIRRVLSIR